ncbi:hypothetical protein ACFE04_026424 [Oxalis oulophora]
MGSEQLLELSSIGKLPLLSIAIMKSPDRSGTLTPPLHASASVPFRWEDKPGKPKPCTTLVPFTTNKPAEFAYPKCLELPPRLLLDQAKFPSPSPTTMSESSYFGTKSSRFVSSFRMVSGGDCYGSFRAPLSPEWIVLNKKVKVDKKSSSSVGSNWKKSKREANVFPSSVDHHEEEANVKKTVINDSKSQFWGNIYEGLKKQVIVPWRGRKQKKETFIIN